MNTLTCVYCGHEYPEGTPPSKHQLLTDHIKVCDKHPMRELERKYQTLCNNVLMAMDILAPMTNDFSPSLLSLREAVSILRRSL